MENLIVEAGETIAAECMRVVNCTNPVSSWWQQRVCNHRTNKILRQLPKRVHEEARMNHIVKKDFLPMIPSPVIPPTLPLARYEGGIVKNWIQNKKLAQLEEMACHEANIYEAYARKARAQMEMLSSMMLAGEKMQNERDEGRYRAEITKAQLDKLKMENQQLYYEMKKAEYEYEQMMKGE
jgi:hypothetical protein